MVLDSWIGDGDYDPRANRASRRRHDAARTEAQA
jgi:hypothetical protein